MLKTVWFGVIIHFAVAGPGSVLPNTFKPEACRKPLVCVIELPSLLMQSSYFVRKGVDSSGFVSPTITLVSLGGSGRVSAEVSRRGGDPLSPVSLFHRTVISNCTFATLLPNIDIISALDVPLPPITTGINSVNLAFSIIQKLKRLSKLATEGQSSFPVWWRWYMNWLWSTWILSSNGRGIFTGLLFCRKRRCLFNAASLKRHPQRHLEICNYL